MLIPTTPYFVLWSGVASIFNVASIFIVTYHAGFHFTTLSEPSRINWIIETTLVVDTLLLFFRAYKINLDD